MISSLHKGSYCSSQNRYLSQQAVILNVGIDIKKSHLGFDRYNQRRDFCFGGIYKPPPLPLIESFRVIFTRDNDLID